MPATATKEAPKTDAKPEAKATKPEMPPAMAAQRKGFVKELESGLIPTQLRGEIVDWYPHGRVDGDAHAAIVTRVEGVGKLTLTIFSPNMVPYYKQGVHYVKHPIAERKSAATVHNNGLWDFPQDRSPRKACYNLHREDLERRIAEIDRQADAIANKASN